MLAKDFPNNSIVYYYFNTWKNKEIIERLHDAMVKKMWKQEERKEEPTAAIVDAQSVKSTLISGEIRGYDAGKKVKGVKRHIMIDSLWLVLAVVIQSASIQDRDGAKDVIEKLAGKRKKFVKIFGDGGY